MAFEVCLEAYKLRMTPSLPGMVETIGWEFCFCVGHVLVFVDRRGFGRRGHEHHARALTRQRFVFEPISFVFSHSPTADWAMWCVCVCVCVCVCDQPS